MGCYGLANRESVYAINRSAGSSTCENYSLCSEAPTRRWGNPWPGACTIKAQGASENCSQEEALRLWKSKSPSKSTKTRGPRPSRKSRYACLSKWQNSSEPGQGRARTNSSGLLSSPTSGWSETFRRLWRAEKVPDPCHQIAHGKAVSSVFLLYPQRGQEPGQAASHITS